MLVYLAKVIKHIRIGRKVRWSLIPKIVLLIIRQNNLGIHISTRLLAKVRRSTCLIIAGSGVVNIIGGLSVAIHTIHALVIVVSITPKVILIKTAIIWERNGSILVIKISLRILKFRIIILALNLLKAFY